MSSWHTKSTVIVIQVATPVKLVLLVIAIHLRDKEITQKGVQVMSIETGALIAMSMGILGAAALTAYALWSKRQERKDPKHHNH